MKFLPLASAVTLFPLVVLAQTPPVGPNLVTNGGFEKYYVQDNLWDGVDGDSYLAGSQGNIEAIGQNGVGRVVMPVSVSVADLNGDSLPDLMTADASGYFRVYFNSGTKQEPKFTNAEVLPIFLSRSQGTRIPKINLYDWARRGVQDLTVGDYAGEIFFLQNMGSASKPEFKQPADLDKAPVQIAKNGLWANLLAPAACDLNKDGTTDLLVGEGSYSANSVHLLINKSSNGHPAFDENGRYYLAYGDGREHLTPTVADYNGDGFLDVITSDREGHVGVYLNPGASWKPGLDFKYAKDVTFGASNNLGSICSVCAADLNGDGLFDLVIGKANGRIAVAYNRGTKTEPKFDPPIDLKGVNIWGRNYLPPLNWDSDAGTGRGNAYAYVSSVTASEDPTAAPPEGKACLKVSYYPSPNKIFGIPSLIFPGDPNAQELLDFFSGLTHFTWKLPSNVIIVRTKLQQVTIGESYTLSMKTKGNGFTNATWTFGWGAGKEIAPQKITRGDRGASVQKFEVKEEKIEQGNLQPSTTWTTINKTINIQKFNDKNLSDLVTTDAALEIRVTLQPNAGAMYLDDVKVTLAK